MIEMSYLPYIMIIIITSILICIYSNYVVDKRNHVPGFQSFVMRFPIIKISADIIKCKVFF